MSSWSDGNQINTDGDVVGRLGMKPATYIVWLNGTNYEAVDAYGKIAYGGSADAGGSDGADAAAVIQDAYNTLTSGGMISLRADTFSTGTTTLDFNLDDTSVYMETGGTISYTGTGVAINVGSASSVINRVRLWNVHVAGTSSGTHGVDVMGRTCDFYNLYVSGFTSGVGVRLRSGGAANSWVTGCAFYSPTISSCLTGVQLSKNTYRVNANRWFGGSISGTGAAVAGGVGWAIDGSNTGDTNFVCNLSISTVETGVKVGSSDYANWFDSVRIETVTTGWDIDGDYTVVYGGSVSSATTDISVATGTGNIVKDVWLEAAPTVTDTATATVFEDVRNYVTQNSGSDSIASGTTSKVVAHGLSVTPSAEDFIIIGKEDPTNSVGTIWVDTIGAANFTVNVENDPGASNWDFGWRVNATR